MKKRLVLSDELINRKKSAHDTFLARSEIPACCRGILHIWMNNIMQKQGKVCRRNLSYYVKIPMRRGILVIGSALPFLSFFELI